MVKVTFLGTAAQIPTTKRNHTGILISHNSENILIDCGENIQRQFRIAKLNPGKVTKILITHKHGDHIFGLPGFLSTLNFSEYNKTLFVYGPVGTKKFIDDLLKALKLKLNFKMVVEEVIGKFFEDDDFYLEAEKMKHGTPTNAYNFIIKDKLRIDKEKMREKKIKEGPHMAKIKEGKDCVYEGKKLKSKDLTYLEKGKKISVVLDTLNNPLLEKFVNGANLFICEASFGSDLKETAKEHLHMVAEDVGKISKKAKVKKVVLTHISQRYETNLKFLIDDVKKNFENVVIAKDFDKFEV